MKRILNIILDEFAKHFSTFFKRYLYTGIVILVVAIALHISTTSVKDDLLGYIENEVNFNIEDEITEDSIIGLENGDKILLLSQEVDLRGDMLNVMYISSLITIVLGSLGLGIKLKSE